ncbi:A24 family peptidase [Desulfovibrio intestinalis]|nr:prepilin peptidase [Desulfovibrio intestinalis]
MPQALSCQKSCSGSAGADPNVSLGTGNTPMIGICPVVAWFVVAFVGMAAGCDLFCRRIPNRMILLVLLLWIAALLWAGAIKGVAIWNAAQIAVGGGWALGVLCGGYVLFCKRLVGAGDVKLASVLCLWAGNEAALFIFATSIMGGIFVLQLSLLRQVETVFFNLVSRTALLVPQRWRICGGAASKFEKDGIPYGPAIAFGFIVSVAKILFA